MTAKATDLRTAIKQIVFEVQLQAGSYCVCACFVLLILMSLPRWRGARCRETNHRYVELAEVFSKIQSLYYDVIKKV